MAETADSELHVIKIRGIGQWIPELARDQLSRGKISENPHFKPSKQYIYFKINYLKFELSWVMGDDIGLGLSSMAVCFDFRYIVQLTDRNPYFYRF